MKYEKYEVFVTNDEHTSFDFASVGPKGKIAKRVMFLPTENPEVISLAFGDLRTDGRIDDRAVTDNGDRNKVLATVAAIVSVYYEEHPQYWIAFQGSTVARTRLYQMAISLNRKELFKTFHIHGVVAPGTIVPFTAEGRFDAFLIKRK